MENGFQLKGIDAKEKVTFLTIKSYSATIQMRATEEYIPKVLFIMLHEVALTLDSEDKILKCEHSNESYWRVLFCDTVCFAVQGSANEFLTGDNQNESN